MIGEATGNKSKKEGNVRKSLGSCQDGIEESPLETSRNT